MCVDYLPSVDVQATEGLMKSTTVYVLLKGLCKLHGHMPKYLVMCAG